ncbi:hypothetical protein ACTFJT_17070, partial [Klebsiella quasipneumoniae]
LIIYKGTFWVPFFQLSFFSTSRSSSCHINPVTNEGIVCFLPDIVAILAFPDDSLFVTKILIRNRAKPLAMRRLIG